MALVNIPRKLPLIFIRNDVLLPGSTLKLPISGLQSVNMVKSRLISRNTLASSIVGVVTLEECKDFHKCVNSGENMTIGTAAFVLQVVGSAWPKSNMFTLYLCGLCRFSLDKLIMEEPYSMGVVTQLDYLSPDNSGCESNVQSKGLGQKVRELAATLVTNLFSSSNTPMSHDIEQKISNTEYASLPDTVMSFLATTYEEKKDVLYTIEINERMKKVLSLLQRQIASIKLTSKSGAPRSDIIIMSVPREQRLLKHRPKHSEEGTDNSDELEELQSKIVKANLPAHVNKIVMRDLQRLKKMGPFSPEDSVLRSYIEYIVDLPWNISSSETIDINKAKEELDKEHYGLEKVKQRVLEYLAVRQLKPSVRGPIICFVGPPGVGKTSIGRSIANILGRQFQRISLGGVNNQADIRGHRRTYIGAMPGRIIQAIKQSGVNNPVILLDELDKMSRGIHGDPAAALLEVLDSLQNNQFMDHYLNVPFDLSQVTFIATANQTLTIPSPLLDRTETINVSGYTMDEKIYIAKHHLLPKQLIENGIDEQMISLPEESLEKLIRWYTREAGVRNLERQIGALCRNVAVKVASSPESLPTKPFEITVKALEDILGPQQFWDLSVSSRVGSPGVAVGLVWTGLGGNLLVVEASKVPGGEGKLKLTGRLGQVISESAHLALNWVRGAAHQFGLVSEGEDLMSDIDVHIHFPEGAVSKEGPSAGITVATALISLFADVPLIPGLAMTGELTLRGIVLPVGGIKEKLLAAHRGGFKKVILPKLSQKELFYVPEKVKEDIQILLVENMEEVIEAAFEGLVPAISPSHSALQSRL